MTIEHDPRAVALLAHGNVGSVAPRDPSGRRANELQCASAEHQRHPFARPKAAVAVQRRPPVRDGVVAPYVRQRHVPAEAGRPDAASAVDDRYGHGNAVACAWQVERYRGAVAARRAHPTREAGVGRLRGVVPARGGQLRGCGCGRQCHGE